MRFRNIRGDLDTKMDLLLSDEEREALADFLNEAIADGLYPLSLRLKPIRSVLARLDGPSREVPYSDHGHCPTPK